MVEISHYPIDVADSRTGKRITFQIGRTSDPSAPIFLQMQPGRWDLPVNEASALAFAGTRISRLIAIAKKNSTSIAEKILYRRTLTGGEIVIETIDDDGEPAASFEFCGVQALFTGDDLRGFISVLGQFGAAVAEHCQAHGDGVQELDYTTQIKQRGLDWWNR